MQRDLVAGQLHIALLLGTAPRPAIDLEPLAEDPLVLVYRSHGAIGDIDPERAGLRGPKTDEPLPLAALPTLPLVVPSRPNALRMLVESTSTAMRGRAPTAPKLATAVVGEPVSIREGLPAPPSRGASGSLC